MAFKVACVRAFADIFYRRLTLTAVSVQPAGQPWRPLVSLSQQYLSPKPPRKPAGAFLQFMNNRSSEITQINPAAGLGERSKIASQLWHNLDPEERNRLKLSAKEELREYREKYLEFMDGLSDVDRDQYMKDKKSRRAARASRRHKAELKKFGKPKMPPNAFMLFVRSSRLERGNAHPTQFLKSLVEYWKVMPQEEKDIYLDDAKQERVRYQREMGEWEERMKEIGREDLIRKKSKKQAKKVVSTKANKSKTKKKKTAKTTSKASKKSVPAKSSKKRTVSKEVQTEE